MIEGVKLIELKQILDERGKIMKMMRNDDSYFENFGEIYFSCIHPNAIKGWHLHKEMTLNYAVIHGKVKLVLYDNRNNSSTKGEIQEIFLGPDNYLLVVIPPLIWNGFKGIGEEMAIVANCSSIPHMISEIERLDPIEAEIPYKWEIQNR